MIQEAASGDSEERRLLQICSCSEAMAAASPVSVNKNNNNQGNYKVQSTFVYRNVWYAHVLHHIVTPPPNPTPTPILI